MATKKLQILNSLVSHDTLTNLDAADQHPIEAVTGLKEALGGKADLVDGKIPVEQLPDDIGAGGGLTEVAWEDIKNKPFGETGWSIEWDTNPTDTFVAIEGSDGFYKVSDLVPTKEELVGTTLKAEADGNHIDMMLADSDIMEHNEYCYGVANMPLFIVTTQATEFNFMGQLPLSFPSAGVWFIYSSGVSWAYYLGKGEIKKIDEKYLPDNIGGGVTSWNDLEDKPFGESGTKITWDNQPTDTIVSTGTKIDWDGTPTSTYEMINKEGMEIYFYKVSESVDTIIDGTVALTTPEGDSDMPLSSEVVQTTDGGENGIEIVNVKVANSTFNFDNAFGGDLTFKESGLYFVSITMNGQVSRVTSFTDQFYGLVLYKIHEPLDTLYGCRMSLIDGEETAELIFKEGDSDLNQPPSVLDSGSSIAMPYLFNIINDNETVVLEGVEISFVQAGLYVFDFALIDMGGVIFNYLALPDYKVVKIDKNFMPDDINLDNYYTKAETDDLIANVSVDLSDYYTKSETDASLTVKADLVNGKVPLEQLPDDIGGGVTSWNDLTDKPFYEVGTNIIWDGNPTNVSVTKGELIEWDGSDTDITLEIPPNEDGSIPPGITLNKIAEKVDSLEGWAFTAISYGDGGTDTMTVEMTSDNITTVLDDAGNIIATHESNYMWVWNVEQAATVSVMGTDVTFPETGIYFVTCAGQFRVTTLCDALVHNMGAQFKLYKVQEPLQGNIYGYKMGITIDGEAMEMVVGDEDNMPYVQTGTGSSAAAPYVCNVVVDNDTFDLTDTFGFEITFPEAGLYMFDCKSVGATLNYFTSPDYDIIKIDEKFLPEGIGASSAGYPHYSGGYLFNFDGNTYLAFNYYALSASSTDWNNLSYEAGMYNIQGTSPFIFTFVAPANISSNNSNIIIAIANKLTGDTSGIDKVYDSDVHVELNRTSKLQGNQWYTYYCVYGQSTGEWVGYLTNTASSGDNDTSELESKINSLELEMNWKQDKNLVTSVNNNSTDSQYPSAKLLYDTKVGLEAQITDISDNVNAKQDKSNLVTSVNNYSTDEQYPSAKLLYDTKTSIENVLQFDNAPTANSTKLVKSGAIATALNDKVSTSTLNNSVNNLTTEINKKANQTALDTAVSDLTTEIGKKANSDTVYTKNEIDGLITGVFYYKGSVDTFAELPATAKVGDTYNVKNADAENGVKAGDNVVWCEIGGVGHWDVLSGIVDLSAYSTSEEIQGKLDEKANKADIPSLDEVVVESDLSTVALSNNYLDLDNKPCYWTGIDQEINWDGQNNNNYKVSFYSKKSAARYFTKISEWDNTVSVEDCKNSFISCTSTLYPIKTNVDWIQTGESYVLEDDNDSLIALIPQDNISVYLSANSPSVIFKESGIYFCRTYNDNGGYVSNAIFKKQYFPLDSIYLPVATTTSLGGVKVGDNLSVSEDGTISATSLDWDNVQNKPELYTKDETYNKTEVDTIKSGLESSINTTKATLTNSINAKVDKVTGSRLMTENEGAKLAGITATVARTNRYNDLDDIPCLLTGVDEIFAWNGHTSNGRYKISDLPSKNYTLTDYRSSFVYFIDEKGNKTLPTSNMFEYKTYNDDTIAAYYYDDSFYSGRICYIVLEGNSSIFSIFGYGTITFEEPGIYMEYNANSKTYISEIKFEGQFTPLKPGYLPVATTSSLGGVRVGANLSVAEDGTISATSLDWDNVEGKPELYIKSEVYNKTEIDTSLNTKQDKSNLVTNVNQYSTDEEYPSAKLLYTTNSALQSSINTNKTDLENSINTTKSDLESSIATARSELKAQIDNKQDVSNLVTSISSSSTDTKYPSAKLLYTTKTDLETQIDTKQDKSNLVTSVNSSSTDTQYPSAKLLYHTKNTLQNSIDTKQNISNLVTTIDENSTDTQYPSAKLLYDIVGNYNTILDEINTLIGE